MKTPYHKHYNFLAVCLLLIALCIASCETKNDKIANKYEDFLTEVHDLGMLNGNVLILENGSIAYQGSFGISNIERIDSLHLNSQFRLASVSKQFTAMGIIKLKESGKLSYDQDIRDFIPELPYKGVTIRHLLNHVSGLPDYERLMNNNWKSNLKYDNPERFISGNIDIINMLAEKKPAVSFNPNEKWEYSNTGYVLLATIVERASGLSFAAYLKEQIFDPAGMTNTSVYTYVQGYDEAMPNRVYGYKVALNGKDQVPNDIHYINNAQGDGGVFSTLGDLLKWDRILYNNEYISTSTREEAFTPAILKNGDTTSYGFGWGISRSPSGKKVVEHSGGWVGFRTFIYREIEENNCIIILTNNSSQYMRSITAPLKNILHNRPYSFPKLAISEAIGKVVLDEGVETAVKEYKKLKSEKPDAYEFSEYQLNSLGYQLMQLSRNEDAVEIYRLSIEENPQSAYTFDKFGDALLASGDTTNALINFKNAISIDSTFIFTKEKIKRIEKKP